MHNQIVAILLLLGIFSTKSNGQLVKQYDLDTLIHYDKSVEEYNFIIEGKKQGLYWDTLNVFNINTIIKVKNNTKSTLTILRIGGGDGAILFLPRIGAKSFIIHAPDSTLLHPDSSIYLSPYINSRKGQFTKPLSISYSKRDTILNSTIITWGNIPKSIARYDESIKNRKKSNPLKPLISSDLGIDNKDSVRFVATNTNKQIEMDSALFEPRVPSFAGGNTALLDFIESNFNKELIKKHNVSGTILVSFMVNIDGSLTNIEILKSVHPILDKELIRILKKSPKWIVAVCCMIDLAWYEPNPDKSNPPCKYCKAKVIIPYKITTANTK